MNREEFIKKWVLFENGNMVKDLDELLSLPPAEGAEQRIRVRNILQDFYRRGEYELEQAEEDIMRLFQPQPTAEGAEEIFRECFAEEAVSRGDTPLSDEKWNDLVKESGGFMFRAMTEFATLHAQRIAEKMVSERLRNELMRYDQWLLANDMGQMFDNTMKCVDEYLKTRESHDR